VPGPDRLLHTCYLGQRGWCIVACERHGLGHRRGRSKRGASSALGSNKRHQEFERAG
jgi:hypothetical protein